MGKTHAKRQEAREQRLLNLPRSERLLKSAKIKKKEGRVLDAAEKHALKMSSEYGEIMKLWETLRVATRTDEAPAATAGGNPHRKVFNDAEDSMNDAAPPRETTGAKDVDRADFYKHKFPIIDKLIDMVKPKFSSLAKTPRVSRVVQSMIKYGSPQHLDTLASWLIKDFADYCTDGFASYVVCALLRHAPHALYRKLLGSILSAMTQISTHTFGLRCVQTAYGSKLCSANDRNVLLLGVFKDSVAVMKTWKGYPVFEDILRLEKHCERVGKGGGHRAV